MITKLLKTSLISAAAIRVAAGATFARVWLAYISSSARSVHTAVKDSVPVEFQLRRARDLVDDIIPEMHANIRLIAQQEVEIENLHKDIDQSRTRLTDETAEIQKLRDALATAD